MKATEQINSIHKSMEIFAKKYYAKIRHGQMTRRPEPIRYMDFNNKVYDQDYYINTYDVQTFDINIAEEEFKKLLNAIEEIDSQEYRTYQQLTSVLGENFISEIQNHKYRESREASLRNLNPGVQKAWENYQLMLKLAGG